MLWKEYAETLSNDERPFLPTREIPTKNLAEPSIMQSSRKSNKHA